MQYTYIFSRVRITILKSTDYSKVKFPKKKETMEIFKDLGGINEG